MKLYLIIGLVCCTALAGLCLVLQGQQVDADTLIVGTESAFPPYEMLDASGQLIGFDIDVMQEVAKKMNKKVIFKIMSFEHLIMALKQKKVDLIIAAISITTTRKAEIELVSYHKSAQGNDACFPLVFWKNIPANVSKIEDLAQQSNAIVSVQSGSVQKDLISMYPFLHMRQLDTIPELVMDIKYGKSLACMLEPVVLESIKKQYPEVAVLNVPLPASFNNEGHGIGIKKGNVELAKQVAQALGALKHEGILTALEQKWLH